MLFQSSKIFQDANVMDCFHQCDIDLRTRPIPVADVQIFLDDVICYMKSIEIDPLEQEDLLTLLFDCFLKYPNELYESNYYSRFKENSFSSIVNFNSTIFISIALNRFISQSKEQTNINVDKQFFSDALTHFQTEIQKSLNGSNNLDLLPGSIQYNSLNFDKKDYLFSIRNLLRVFPVTSEVLTPFIPILFGDKNPAGDFKLDLVAHIAASNLLNLIPEKYYITLAAYIDSPCPSLVFADLVPYIPTNSFYSVAPSLEVYLSSLGNPEMSLVFFKKCSETGFSKFSNFQSFFSVIETKYLDSKMIEFLHQFEFTFTDAQVMQLQSANVDFEKDPIFYLTTLPAPQNFLNDRIIEEFFDQIRDEPVTMTNQDPESTQSENDNAKSDNNNTKSEEKDGNNPNILRRTLKPVFTHPSLAKISNWAKFIKIIDPDSFGQIGKCFVNNAIDVGDSAITLLKYSHLDTKVCDFLRAVLNKDNRDIFVTSPRLQELLSTINFQPPFSFWRLFSKSRGLINFAVGTNFRCPYIMYGVATVTSFTKLDPNFQTMYIEPQTEQSFKKLDEYISRTCINKTALFTSIDGGPAELSLMASAHYYGTRIAYHQAKCEIVGLAPENILYFTIIASMTYKVTNRLHAGPIYLDLFTDDVMYQMTVDGIRMASKEVKAVYFDHVLNAMPTLYLFNTFQSKLRPIILDIFKSGDYNPEQMELFLIHMSHSTASPTVFLRRSLIKDTSYVTPATNEPTKETLTAIHDEERHFWNEVGIDALKLLTSREYKPDFQLNFHCDCLQDKNVLNEMLNEHPTANLIRFLEEIAISTPKFEIKDDTELYRILDEEIQKENWTTSISIIRFLCKIEKTEKLMTYFKKDLPPLIDLALTSVFKQSDAKTMREYCTIDFVINLMSSQVRVFDTKIRYFVERILNDDDTLLHYYIFELNRIQRGFCVTTQTISGLFYDELQRNPESFGKAVHCLYSQPDEVEQILLKRPTPLPIKPPSQFSIDIAQRMIDAAFDDQNPKLLCWTTYFIQSHGFLFENFDHIKYFEKMFSVLKDFGHSKTESTFRASLTTLALLYFYISISSITDKFFEWFFAFRNNFNPSQIYAFLLILRAFLSVDAVKTIMAAVLVRYDFLTFIPSQYNEFQYCVVTRLFLDALKEVLDSDFYTFDAIVCDKTPFATAFNEGTQSLQRILQQSNPLIFISSQLDEDDQGYIATITRDRFFKRESENADARVLEQILSKYHHRPPESDENETYDDDDVFIPDWLSKEAVDNLPQKQICTLLHHGVPKLPKSITPTMQRYLFTLPNWVALWIKNPSTLLLLPCHYKVIYETIEQLNRISKNDFTPVFKYTTKHDFESPKINQDIPIEIEFVKNQQTTPKLPFVISPKPKPEFIPTLYHVSPEEKENIEVQDQYGNVVRYNTFRLSENQKLDENTNCIYSTIEMHLPNEIKETTFYSNHLFESLLKIASFGEMSDLFSQLLKSIGDYQPCLTSLLNHIGNKLLGISNGNIISCARILEGVSKCDAFTRLFELRLSDSFQQTICAPRFHLSTVLFHIVSNIFGNIKSQLSDRTVQVIEQMLLSGGNSFQASLVPYSKLPNDKKEILSNSIAVACDKALDESINGEVVSTAELLTFLKTVPELMKKRKSKLLKILKKLLERYDSSNNELIIELFSKTMPPENDMKWTTRSENSNVPQEVIDKNPEFWNIVIKHSHILSKLLNSDKKLIETSLSFVKLFPALLDFPLRLSLFNQANKRKLKKRILKLKVNRDKIIEDSFEIIRIAPRDTFLGEINVSFVGEEGVDMGGIRRDWYTSLIRALFNPGYALFTKDREPNPTSNVIPMYLLYFDFAGKMLARAVIDNVNVDCHLPTVLCKEILGVKVTLRDLEKTDPELFRSLQWMSKNDVEPLEMKFTFGSDELGVHKEIPLIDNGENIDLTNENKEEFIEKVVRYRLVGRTKEQTDAFVAGFHSLISKDELKMFNPSELDLIICGLPIIDVRDMRQYSRYTFPFTADHPAVERFFAVIRHWPRDDLGKLLLFVTGSSQMPIGGFKAFKDSGMPFTLAPGGDHDRLPAAHTCINTLDLPEYRSENELNEKLHLAINECNTFGFQ